MIGCVEFTVESLSAHRAADKLSRAGIEVLSAVRTQKNAVDLRIRAKDCKKAFAILRGSCYNIKNVRSRGALKAFALAVRSAGLLVGAMLFLGGVLFAEHRVLAVEYVGNGAYLAREAEEVLARAGVKRFSPMPRDTGALTAELLALPRVEFCAVRRRGGVLTVELVCADGSVPLGSLPLTAPASGVIEELVVVRGTAVKGVGDAVSAGETVVSAVSSDGAPVLVIARVKVSFPVAREYGLEEREALLQAHLDFGENAKLHTEKTERGWLVAGTAYAEAAVNLG